jgi:hypothetical protein
MTVHTATPGSSFLVQGSISKPALAQALPGEQADGDFGLVQPTAVLGRVVYRESAPQTALRVLAKASHYGLTRMRTQMVHDQMDGVGLRVTDGDIQQVIGELGRRTCSRYLGTTVLLSAPLHRTRWPFHNVCIRRYAELHIPAAWPTGDAPLGGERPVSWYHCAFLRAHLVGLD